MPILIIIFILLIYFPLGVIFNLTKNYSGGSKKRTRRRKRKFWSCQIYGPSQKNWGGLFLYGRNKSVVFESEWLHQFILCISKLRISQPKSLRHFVRKNHQIFYLRFKNMGDTMIVTYGRNQIWAKI